MDLRRRIFNMDKYLIIESHVQTKTSRFSKKLTAFAMKREWMMLWSSGSEPCFRGNVNIWRCKFKVQTRRERSYPIFLNVGKVQWQIEDFTLVNERDIQIVWDFKSSHSFKFNSLSVTIVQSLPTLSSFLVSYIGEKCHDR